MEPKVTAALHAFFKLIPIIYLEINLKTLHYFIQASRKNWAPAMLVFRCPSMLLDQSYGVGSFLPRNYSWNLNYWVRKLNVSFTNIALVNVAREDNKYNNLR